MVKLLKNKKIVLALLMLVFFSNIGAKKFEKIELNHFTSISLINTLEAYLPLDMYASFISRIYKIRENEKSIKDDVYINIVKEAVVEAKKGLIEKADMIHEEDGEEGRNKYVNSGMFHIKQVENFIKKIKGY